VPSHNTDLSLMSTYGAHSPPVPDPIVPSHNTDRSSQSKFCKATTREVPINENFIKPEFYKVPIKLDPNYENSSKYKFCKVPAPVDNKNKNSSQPDFSGKVTTSHLSLVVVGKPATSTAPLAQPRNN
jgi:hypothetical protein